MKYECPVCLLTGNIGGRFITLPHDNGKIVCNECYEFYEKHKPQDIKKKKFGVTQKRRKVKRLPSLTARKIN